MAKFQSILETIGNTPVVRINRLAPPGVNSRPSRFPARRFEESPMRMLRCLTAALLALLLAPVPAFAVEIPAFTPNVVDPGGYLSESETQTVNTELQRIRETSHIWGAVFIVDTLAGEPIENVAVEAFEKWQLGQQGVDNGLLLILSMSDRKSRFEVGYGLEGTITDVVARRALDAHLAPRMREGDTAGAIVDAFAFLSRIVAQDPDAIRELDQAQPAEQYAWRLGFIAWGVFLFAVWFCFPIRNRRADRLRARLQALNPALSLDDEDVVRTGSAGAQWKGNVFLQCFLSINPGVFVLVLSAFFVAGFVACVIATLLILFLTVHLSTRRYASPEHYRQFLEHIARKRKDLIRDGYLEETEPGTYAYTPAYHASRASSSSSGSSGSSSSSGGGRSGGGGASSGW